MKRALLLVLVVMLGLAVSAPAQIRAGLVNLTSMVTGILPPANGGTGNGFTKFSGPATSEKTFTLPNASATIPTTTDNLSVFAATSSAQIATLVSDDLSVGSSPKVLLASAFNNATVWSASLTNGTNVAASGSFVGMYFQIGDRVFYSFTVAIDPTSASSQTVLTVTLPVASNFATSTDALGTCSGILTDWAPTVLSDSTADAFQVIGRSNTIITNQTYVCSGQYKVI